MSNQSADEVNAMDDEPVEVSLVLPMPLIRTLDERIEGTGISRDRFINAILLLHMIDVAFKMKLTTPKNDAPDLGPSQVEEVSAAHETGGPQGSSELAYDEDPASSSDPAEAAEKAVDPEPGLPRD